MALTVYYTLQFVNSNQVLATLPGAGVGQNLVSLAPCAVNQPHVHPRGTEISHVTKGGYMHEYMFALNADADRTL